MGPSPFYAPFSIPGIRRCVYFRNGQGGCSVSGEGHGEGLNYTGPVVTSAKIITCLATASSSSRYRILRELMHREESPARTPRAERKTECTSQGGKRKRAGRAREKGGLEEVEPYRGLNVVRRT